MDYKKLHEDTITKLQQMVNSGKITVEVARGICADFVSESEDEKVRKAIINVFAAHKDYEIFFDVSAKDIIAWLENQGEQRERLINKACNVLVDCIEDFMLRRMEVWSEECKKQTLENIRKTLEE